jgi:hypothetical protein
MDKNVTKKGLLALKDSKPVPITAHSHEIIVPCVYTETVKKMMKEKGIVLPLTPAKLAELRKIAKATPGQYKADPDEKAGGTSHAKGTTNVAVSIKNIIGSYQGRQGVRRKRGRGVGAGRSKIITSRASGLIPAPPSMHPGMVVNPNYNLIRPFVANTPMGYEPRPVPSIEQVKQELSKESALEKRLLSYDRLNEKVNHLEKQNRRFMSDFLVDEDSFVDEKREEVVREKMAPKSEVVIEDVSASSEPYEPAAEAAAVAPTVYVWDLDKADLIEKIRSKGDRKAQVNYLMGFENHRLKTIARTLGVSPGKNVKGAIVSNIVLAPALNA